jgi:ribose-phosphate pyrophosphokinase
MILLNGEEVQFGKFPNNETHVITKIEATENAPALDFFKQNIQPHNIITFKYEDDGDFMKLLFVRSHLESIGMNICDLVIYYMPYSRMDRSEGGSVFTLKYTANLINAMEFNKVYVVEPHSDVTTALIDRAVPLMPTDELLVIAMNETDFDLAEDFVVYPDAGAQKRYGKSFEGNTLVGYKSRDFETGKLTKFDLVGVPYPKPEGRKAIIVDDLCSRGGTPMMTADALKKQGFTEIYLVVTHCEENIFNGDVLKEDSPINKVFTTDSIITEDSFVWDKAQYKDKVVIAKLEELIIEE